MIYRMAVLYVHPRRLFTLSMAYEQCDIVALTNWPGKE